MGRQAKFDKAAAVDTVMYAMWQDGYEAWSIKAISEKLGITRTSFYHAFGSREAMFETVLARYFELSPDKALDHIGEDSILEAITRLFWRVCEIRANDQDRKGCLVMNSIGELVSTNENLGPLLEKGVKHSLARFEQLLAVAAERGEIAPENIAGKALALQNLLIGLNVMCKVVTDEAALKLMVRTNLEALSLFKLNEARALAMPVEEERRQ